MTEIYRSFTSPEAPRQLNLSAPLMKRMNMDIKQTTSTTLPAMELIFSDAQDRVEGLLAADVYPRFVKHQMTLSAERALASGRSRYGGLGDCFCLTDPAWVPTTLLLLACSTAHVDIFCRKADNPIVYASDGFVKVTGYSRTDIVPRNCRFLQGKYTDQAASRRIKEAITAKQESVELLLNYRKNGEPFWNLLYIGKDPSSSDLKANKLIQYASALVQFRRQGSIFPRRANKLFNDYPQPRRHSKSALYV